MNIVLSNKHTKVMKKLPIFLSALVALGAGAFSGCQIKRNAEQEEPEQQIHERTNEKDDSDGDKCPNRCPRVDLKHRKGYAVGFNKKFDGGEIFIIQFGNGEPELPDFPQLPEQPALPDNE